MPETPKPNPSMFAPVKQGFQKIGEEAQKGGEALKRLEEAIPTNKEQGPRKPFVRKDHLTQRPFLDKDLIGFRRAMDRPVRIKKK